MSIWIAIPICLIIVGTSVALGYQWGTKDLRKKIAKSIKVNSLHLRNFNKDVVEAIGLEIDE